MQNAYLMYRNFPITLVHDYMKCYDNIFNTYGVRWIVSNVADSLDTQDSRIGLTLKHRETHGCVVSTVATDALVLKHQAISIHNAD